MNKKRTIFAIVGSASKHSANEKLVDFIQSTTKDFFSFTVLRDLKTLPHFDPEQANNHPPEVISSLRQSIASADGILICTPEYIFSVPSGLKNLLEWCVATTIFSDKPVGIITASTSGQQGHEELKLILKTLSATFTEKSTLVIQGIRSKMNAQGELTDETTRSALTECIEEFKRLVFERL